MMTIELLKPFLLYNLVFNVSVVTLWFSVFTFKHDWLYSLHARWFQIPVSQFDTLHYTGIMIYKVGIYFLNLAPLVGLWLIPY
jgi:hypothetical protein